MRRFSFQYLPFNCTTGWLQKERTWTTQRGAEKAATKWEEYMKSEGCEIAARIVEIIDNRPVVIKGVPFARN